MIFINFPFGAGGHKIGRLLASCNNVPWYDHEPNGKEPWMPYIEKDLYGVDKCFTPYHFNRRFKGANGTGICDKTIIPILDKSKIDVEEQRTELQKYINKNILYPTHSKLSDVRNLIDAKHLVVIPNNVHSVVQRFLKTTLFYYVDPSNKSRTFKDMYEEIEKETGFPVIHLVRTDIQNKIADSISAINSSDVVVNSVEDLYEEHQFKKICKQLELEYNDSAYKKVRKFCQEDL